MITKINKPNAFITIFLFAFMLAYWVSSYSKEWIDQLEVEKYNHDSIERKRIDSTVYSDYFDYYNLYFEKWMRQNWVYSGDEAIAYLSDREIFQPLESFNTKENIYRDMDWSKTYLWWKITPPADLNNIKSIQPRALKRWTLPITCRQLWLWDYMVEHIIWVQLKYGITKSTIRNTYFSCIDTL